MPDPLSETEIQRRLAVWIAFSDLYLDTETQVVTYKSIARACRASGYTRDELRGILFVEVGPALGGNLLSVAGEWAMFSAEDVERLVREQLRQRRNFPWLHRKRLTRYTAEAWATIETWLNRPAVDLEP